MSNMHNSRTLIFFFWHLETPNVPSPLEVLEKMRKNSELKVSPEMFKVSLFGWRQFMCF
uniref:Uncharacterized protein n=1 Tax=Rhizophora mucronata TaxID=61149 RepID=A0A2P2PW12_RHIMU